MRNKIKPVHALATTVCVLVSVFLIFWMPYRSDNVDMYHLKNGIADSIFIIGHKPLGNEALDSYEGGEGDSVCDSLFHVYCIIKK